MNALLAGAAWLVPAMLFALILLTGALWSLRRQRRCPSCREPMQTLGQPPVEREGEHAAYEVLVCESCSNAATLVHGHQARFAYCPSCLNRSLRTPCMRRTDGTVHVAEHCEICGYNAERVVGEPSPVRPMGQVIPFPVGRARPPQRADDA